MTCYCFGGQAGSDGNATVDKFRDMLAALGVSVLTISVREGRSLRSPRRDRRPRHTR